MRDKAKIDFYVAAQTFVTGYIQGLIRKQQSTYLEITLDTLCFVKQNDIYHRIRRQVL